MLRKILPAKSCFFFFLAVVSFYFSRAQMPVCGGPNPMIYLLTYTTQPRIWNYDPSLPTSATNPVQNTIPLAPLSGGALAVSNNLNGPGPSPTFYTIVNTSSSTAGNQYMYYDGTAWVNTGHFAGPGINIGAGGGYIYNLDITGVIYRYDGTGPATYLMTVPWTNPGAGDIQVDCNGDFYIFTSYAPARLDKYSPNGTLLQTWTTTGFPATVWAGPGFGIIGNTVYWYNNSNLTTNDLWIGTLGATSVNFTGAISLPSPPATNIGDFGTCQLGQGGLAASIDTGYYCGTGPGVPITATGNGPFVWTVISGPAVITGSGSSITVTTTATSRILLTSTTVDPCNEPDTVTIIVPTATISLSPDTLTLTGCGNYHDTLHAFLNNTVPSATYNIGWTPASSIVSGGNTLNPVIAPVSNTLYIITVATPASQGGCTWQDSIMVIPNDKAVHVDFTYTIKYGCEQDTIVFVNQTTGQTHSYWSFGDNTGDTTTNPKHIYTQQGIYTIRLEAGNSFCSDTISKTADLLHPLEAGFVADTICMGQTAVLTNTSVTTTKNNVLPTYAWSFGDNTGDTAMNPQHVYLHPGTYQVRLIVTDFVPCHDTAYGTVVVDSMAEVKLTCDSIICLGQGIKFQASFLTAGSTGYIWDMGDGIEIKDRNPVHHGYDATGIFTIKFTVSYRVCGDTTAEKTITVNDYPTVDVGPDTSICPGDLVSLNGHAGNITGPANWLWNRGETVSSILVNEPGVYYATVDKNGCTTTDSVQVFNDCYLDIPNVFTPNGDDLNNYFFPRGLLSRGVTKFRMQVYNRWGQLIFETTNINGRGWDGKFNDRPQPAGVFVYLLEADLKNGKKIKRQGNVTLIR